MTVHGHDGGGHPALRRSVRPFAAALTIGIAACGSGPAADARVPESFGEVLAMSLFEGASPVDRLINDSVRRCMAEQGFEFPAAVDSPAGPGGLADAEYVDAYGYGISTEPPLDPAPAADPLQQALDQLRPDEVGAFHRALLGSEDPAAAPSPGSCLGRAFAELEQFQSLLTDELFSLADDYRARVEADPRVVDARSSWQTCLAERGYGPHRDRIEIVQDLSARMEETRTTDDLTDLQAFERTIAGVDFACSQAEIEAREQVEAELSSAFAEDVARVLLATGADGD